MCLFNKLKGRIVEKYGSQNKFAKALNVSGQWVSMKMQGKSPFTKQDMSTWGKLLDIDKEEYIDYFF